jgi:peptidoglycan lytic transglycosylase G
MAPLFGRGDEGRQRTAADREAARLERERKRALREGREPPETLPASDETVPPPPLDEEPPAPLGDEPSAPRDEESPDEEPPAALGERGWEPFAHDAEPEPDLEPLAGRPDPAAREPEPAAREPEPAAPDPEPAVSEPEPDRSDPQATQPLEPVGAIHARRTVSLPRPQTDADGGGQHTDSWDRPIGTVRVSRAEYQAQPGAPGMPPHRNLGVRKARRRWARRAVALLAILLLAGIAVLAFMTYQPFHGKGYGAVVLKIPEGSSAGDVGDLLARNDVVDSGFFFELRARLSGDRGKLRAGTYTLKKSMPYKDALAALTQAPKAAPTIDVTLPEGPSRRELAPRVKAAGVRGDYVKASAKSSLLNPRTYGAPKRTRSLEGFLFPDTFQLRSRTATARALVALQLRDFKRQFAKVSLTRARRQHLSRYDVLIIASMIEREALVPKDRRLISAVIYNRLQKDIPLGIDATLRYRLNNWTKPLKESELQTNSDFNTRKVQGLPPTPIGNPGLASIQAAADPANVKYLFYVVKPCGNGAHAFSSTDAQFQKDVAAYKSASRKRGGKDPSHC